MKKIITIALIVLAAIIALIATMAAIIYFWPHQTNHLQAGVSQTFNYDQAIKKHAEIVQEEQSQNVQPKCTSKLLTHEKRTTKTVVMLHGVTACPDQFTGLGKVFYDAGYNVYIPRTPYHGFADKKSHAEVRSNDLVDYVNTSISLATGLGDDLGVVGLSGGGMLATWASEYRPEVSRALILSPFYEPAAAQAPKWQLPFLNFLYGFHIVPDTFTVPATPEDATFSYRALANYNIITKNLKSDPSNLSLKTLGLVIAKDDDQIDLSLGHSIPESIVKANPDITFTDTELPAEWNIGHDVVSLDNKNVAARQDQLFALYLNSYEGRATVLRDGTRQ